MDLVAVDSPEEEELERQERAEVKGQEEYEEEEEEEVVQDKHNGEIGVEVACCIEHGRLKMHSAACAPALPVVLMNSAGHYW